jgi:two-component system sensor histidine kinase HydH
MIFRKKTDSQKAPGLLQNRYLLTVVLLLGLFSIITLISAIGTYRISIQGSRHLLETRATDIAVNLGFTLERLGLNPDLFCDLVESDRWEYLAFLALIDKDRTIILHSNQKLIGRKINDPVINQVFRRERIFHHFEKLATGEEVFILDFPLKLHIGEVNRMERTYHDDVVPELRPRTLEPVPALRIFCLRVALHPYPARSIERRAKFQLIMILASLSLLWILALFFIRAWQKNYRLEKSLAEKERMAALGQMAAVLAHEIRNPLSSIKGFAQIYVEDAQDPDLREDMAVIVEQADRLERLTANLLVYARPTKLNIQAFPLDALCKELDRLVSAEKKGVILDLRCNDKTVRADREKLIQIVLNLVQNSIEAMADQDSEKKVSVEIMAREDGIDIRVTDTGRGFPEDLGKDIFEPFVTTKTKGTGLGLAIVKRLVIAMDGKIEAGNNPEGGSVVEIFLPWPGEEHG